MAKVAILSFYSQIVDRGVETFVYEISRRLQGRHTVTVFQAGIPRPQKYNICQIKIKAQIPQSSKGLAGKFYIDVQSLRILAFTVKAIPMLIKGKFDVIFPLNGGWQSATIRIFTKITGAKTIIPGEAGIGRDDAWNLLFRPDVFAALTTSQANWARKLTPEVQTMLIPNGVDLSKFNPKVRPKELNLKKPIVVCASALVPVKRVKLTIKAVAKANLSLLLLGDGEMKGVIDSLGKRLLGVGYLRVVVPYSDIPSFYRVGKVFTLASKTEAFGTSYIEAMACNLPVVTTSDDSRAEIIGDAGILTDPTDIEKYAKDLEIAAHTNYRNKPYNQSLKFSWNKIAQKYSTLISGITRLKD